MTDNTLRREPSHDQPLIDAHHHLWALDGQVAYPWLEESPVENFFLGDYAAIRQPFVAADLKRLVPEGFRLVGSVHCEAEAARSQALEETRWITRQQATHALPSAHVGWAAFGTDECAAQLDAQCESPLFRGVRAKPVTAATPQTRQSVTGTRGSLQDPRWCEGLALLQARGLSWDLRVPAWHLEEAATTLQDYPGLRVILNHCGLPWDRTPQGLAQWRAGMRALSENPNVAVKLSELGTPWHAWDARANRELLCEVLNIFGAQRCLFASNFPVSGLKVSYGDWLALVTSAIEQMMSADLRQRTLDKVLHDNAIHWYRLPIAAIASSTDAAAVTSSTATSTTPSITPSTATHTTLTAWLNLPQGFTYQGGDTMSLNGHQLIGQRSFAAQGEAIHAINPATGERLEPAYPGANASTVEEACQLASQAFDAYRATSPDARAVFLETIADEIGALGDTLTQRAMQETGLPEARLNGERGRTCGQLKLFAKVLRRGEWQDVRVDPALPERAPLPRADLRQRQIPLGPVAVFGASNFPLAFSVAGGDTASALAAGCPVVVKGHSAHPGTSELVGQAVARAAKRCEMPEGVFSLLFGPGNEVGQALVKHPEIQAVGFTGSRSGGTALLALAQARPQPIPVYAEMSSINPVILMPAALEARGEALGSAFVGSLNMGAGQFCTNPGLVLAVKGEALERFKQAAIPAIQASPVQTMLTPGIHKAYAEGVASLSSQAGITCLASGESDSPIASPCQTQLFSTQASDFLANEAMQAEVFGSSSLIIECDDLAQLKQVCSALEGQLTATLHLDDADHDAARQLLPVLERRAGRILVNGWPTGVEVCDAMVHGGPWPATSDSRTTSVGTAAIHRFLRPVCYQDLPDALLPPELKHDATSGISRLVDGVREGREAQ